MKEQKRVHTKCLPIQRRVRILERFHSFNLLVRCCKMRTFLKDMFEVYNALLIAKCYLIQGRVHILHCILNCKMLSH